jgi:hypothetical protein
MVPASAITVMMVTVVLKASCALLSLPLDVCLV